MNVSSAHDRNGPAVLSASRALPPEEGPASLERLPAVGPSPIPPFLRCLLLLYDFLWFGVTACWLLFRLIRRPPKGSRVIGDRLGRLPARPPAAPVALWIHAVSVGELLSVRPVLRALKQRHPDWWVLLTTTQRHAHDIARSQAGADAVAWLPWDFGPCVEAALGRARPDLLVLVECELWPNLIARASRRAPVLLMNARIYERDFPRYRLGRFLFGPLLNRLALIGTQSEGDRQRFLRLGAPPERLTPAGNTKFDAGRPADLESRLTQLRALLPLGPGPLWVLASTHDDEEVQVLSRCRPLARRWPGLQFLIAPRHPERAAAICRAAGQLGCRAVLRSRLPSPPPDGSLPEVIVLDTMGELPAALGLADLVFIGGSLADQGGHNPIEPGLHGKPILIGPSVYNFAEVVAAFRAEQALVQVNDAEELVARAGELLADSAAREALGRGAAAVVGRHAGAAAAYVSLFERLAPGVTGVRK